MNKKIFKRLALVVSVGLAFATSTALANHSWGGYHWARTTPQFTLKLGNNLTSTDWRSHLSSSSANWNSGRTPLLTSIVAGSSNKRCSMVVGTTQVCNSEYGHSS